MPLASNCNLISYLGLSASWGEFQLRVQDRESKEAEAVGLCSCLRAGLTSLQIETDLNI